MMDTLEASTTMTTPDPVIDTLAKAKHLETQLVEFIDGVRSKGTGETPWAILADPEFLRGIVSLLAFKHANGIIARADTRVSEEDVKSYLGEMTYPALRKPAMWATLFGVHFIGAVGIPPGALCFVPAAPLDITFTVFDDGSETTSMGKAGPS